jgi:hypothetical protein
MPAAVAETDPFLALGEAGHGRHLDPHPVRGLETADRDGYPKYRFPIFWIYTQVISS